MQRLGQNPPDSPVLPQIAAGAAAVAERGEEFPHMYTHGCVMKDVSGDCTGFVADVVHSSRRSVDALNTTPRRGAPPDPVPMSRTLTLTQVMTCSPWAAWQMLLKVPQMAMPTGRSWARPGPDKSPSWDKNPVLPMCMYIYTYVYVIYTHSLYIYIHIPWPPELTPDLPGDCSSQDSWAVGAGLH